MPVSKKRKKPTPSTAPANSPPPHKKPIHRSTVSTMVGIAVAVVAAGWMIATSGPEDATIQVIVPELSKSAQKGRETYNRICTKCHGENAGGSKNGPPLINAYYTPSHHADIAFVNAIRSGVRQHHWKYGHMPPQPDVKLEETPNLIAYVREIQQANGIY